MNFKICSLIPRYYNTNNCYVKIKNKKYFKQKKIGKYYTAMPHSKLIVLKVRHLRKY